MVQRSPMTDRNGSRGSSDEFIMVEDERTLPLRHRTAMSPDGLALEIHPNASADTFLISVKPPTAPREKIEHVSCDIVLVIDVSASMRDPAPLPDIVDKTEKEATGLSILDLTKHAARMIVTTLNEGDRLGIVTFSTNAEVIQPLIHMTDANRKDTIKRVENLQTYASTNLWSGIRTSLDLFQKSSQTGNIQGVYVLTDGMPNFMCPPQGYVAKLSPMFEAAALKGSPLPSIHTFGFGYFIRSGLMQAIAEAGGGRYAFIPDAGMIGTVFVHAIANLYTTFATSARLEIETDLEIDQSSGLDLQTDKASDEFEHLSAKTGNKKLELVSIHYGQSRDVLIEYKSRGNKESSAIKVNLTYMKPDGTVTTVTACRSVSDLTDLPPRVFEYHRFRTQLCAFLSHLFPVRPDGERVEIVSDKLPDARSALQDLSRQIRSSQYCDDADIGSLAEDIDGEGSSGQISKAFIQTSRQSYWLKWGQHYLRSLLHAHSGQVCNSFKDPGPLRYGKDSPLFVKSRDQLDEIFDTLPAPKPSINNIPGKQIVTNVSMKRYNSRSNPCFEANSHVRLASGSTIKISKLRPGLLVWTPVGPTRVVAVVETKVRSAELCKVGNLWLTPWHPVKRAGSWVFPLQICTQRRQVRGHIYSVMLNRSEVCDSHAIEVEGQVAVTLGHGVLIAPHDARSHVFFGNYDRIAKSLMLLPKDARGISRCAGMKRSVRTGLACGFVAAKLQQGSYRGRMIVGRHSQSKVLVA